MDQSEVVGERADHRHQVQARLLALPERQVEAIDPDSSRPKQVRDLLNALLVGPHAAPDGQRRPVNPDAVAALDGAGRFDPAEDRDAEPAVGGFMEGRLRAPQRLAHGEDQRAVVGHQRGVVRENGIGETVVVIRQELDRRARLRHEVDQTVMLGGGAGWVELRTVVPFGRVCAAHRTRCPTHQHPFQRGRHRLRSVFLHRKHLPPVVPNLYTGPHACRKCGQSPVDGAATGGPCCIADGELVGVTGRQNPRKQRPMPGKGRRG